MDNESMCSQEHIKNCQKETTETVTYLKRLHGRFYLIFQYKRFLNVSSYFSTLSRYILLFCFTKKILKFGI